LSSGLGGTLVLIFTSCAEGGGVIPKFLVSVSLGSGSLDNTGLVDNAFVEVEQFTGEAFRVFTEVGNDTFNSGSVVSVVSNSLVFVFNDVLEFAFKLVL
jgi:hypothetical protein